MARGLFGETSDHPKMKAAHSALEKAHGYSQEEARNLKAKTAIIPDDGHLTPSSQKKLKGGSSNKHFPGGTRGDE